MSKFGEFLSSLIFLVLLYLQKNIDRFLIVQKKKLKTFTNMASSSVSNTSDSSCKFGHDFLIKKKVRDIFLVSQNQGVFPSPGTVIWTIEGR